MSRTTASGEALGEADGTAFEAVFFDVGNTLLYPFPSVPAVVLEVLEEAGHEFTVEEIDRYMPVVDAYYEDRYKADDTFWTDESETSDVWVGMYSLLCRELDIHADAETLARRVYDEFGHPHRWRAYGDVPAAFERLAARGMRVGIISNWDTRLAGILIGLGLGSAVDAVISSAQVGLHKPDPRIFELACDRLGVRADRSAHVGDHYYADVIGARTAGLAPVLIDRHGDGDAPADVPVVTTLDALEDALGI